MLFHAAGGVEEQYGYVAAFDGFFGAQGAVVFDAAVDFCPFAETGGVDEDEFFFVAGEGAVDGVAGGAGYVGDDVALCAEQGVDET